MLKKYALPIIAALVLIAGIGMALLLSLKEPAPTSSWAPGPGGLTYAQTQVAKAKAGPIDRLLTRILAPGPLVEAHKDIGSCFACHSAFTSLKETRCSACHREEDLVGTERSRAADTHKSTLGTVTCTACHTEHQGRDATITFDYDHSVLPPKTLAACANCHAVNPGYHLGVSLDAQRTAATTLHENHAKGYGGVSCSECHTTESWTPDTFVHAPQGEQGAPTRSSRQARSKSCAECHVSELQVHERQGKYSANCQTCHTVESWKPTSFSHLRRVGETAGAVAASERAGAVGHSPGGATGCTNCHAREKPSHGSAFGQACGACHSTKQWTGASAGPLAMANLAGDGTCASCHLKEAKAHVDEPEFGPNCSQCHNANGWTDVSLDHSLVAGQACTKCHAAPQMQTHPNTTGTGVTCDACHSTNAWRPASFDHATLADTSRFTCTQCHAAQKTGKHKDGRVFDADCALCHNPKDPDGTTFDHAEVSVRVACSACHSSDIPAKPSHKSFVANCALCHSSNAWRPARFQHEGVSDFGAKSCLSCHTADYRAHDRTWLNQQTGRTCEQCHDVNRWKPANFSHAAAVASPRLTCLSCHRVPANSWLHRNVAPKGCLQCHTLQSWSAIIHGG